MNWKKFLVGTAIVTGAVAVGLAWVPVYLLPYAPIWTWTAEVGIALGGLFGIKKVWENAGNTPAQKIAEPVQVVPLPKTIKKNKKENQQERDTIQVEHPKRRLGFRAPKLIARWRAKRAQQKQNYRDAA